jgi:uncharacterized protein (DUF2252 family)
MEQTAAAPETAAIPSASSTNADAHAADLPGLIERIRRFNAGRDPQRLRLKYQSMRRDPFSFFRGACHLFYDDLPSDWPLHRAPLTWICGDLHLQNFGIYRGDDDRVHIDISDFDEGCLAPVTWDLSRFLASLLLASEQMSIATPQASRLCEAFLEAYRISISRLEPGSLEHASVGGAVRRIMSGARQRARASYLDARTESRDGMRRLRIDGKKALAADPADRGRIAEVLSAFAAGQPNPEAFGLLDVARRIAGVGSLGLERYVVLVSGKGSPDGNYLLDLKHQPGSSLAPHLQLSQPAWKDEASRVVWIEGCVQAVAPRGLNALTIGDRAYTLRELLPNEDRLKLDELEGRPDEIAEVLQAMGRIVAWGGLRCASHRGAASVDELAAFAARSDWSTPLIAYASSYADKTRRDWGMFCHALDEAVLDSGG